MQLSGNRTQYFLCKLTSLYPFSFIAFVFICESWGADSIYIERTGWHLTSLLLGGGGKIGFFLAKWQLKGSQEGLSTQLLFKHTVPFYVLLLMHNLPAINTAYWLLNCNGNILGQEQHYSLFAALIFKEFLNFKMDIALNAGLCFLVFFLHRTCCKTDSHIMPALLKSSFSFGCLSLTFAKPEKRVIGV